MSEGDLRRDVDGLFGRFFADKGFKETGYFHDPAAFGNEFLRMTGPRHMKLEFTRDRGFISLSVLKGSLARRFVDVRRLLKELDTDDRHYGTFEDSGMQPALVQDVKLRWEELIKRAASAK